MTRAREEDRLEFRPGSAVADSDAHAAVNTGMTLISVASLMFVACSVASAAQQAYIQASRPQEIKEVPMIDLENLADLQASCPAGTELVGPTGPDGVLFVVNGRVAAACMSPDGTYRGPSMTWHANGSRATAGDYRNGLKEGAWCYWHENGHISGQGAFRDDKPEGVWVTWHDNGQKESEGSYLAGLQQGLFTYWNRDGQIVQVLDYDHGHLKKTISYRDGKPMQ